MPYSVSWIEENHILRIVALGDVTLQEAAHLNSELMRVLDECTPPIDFITDVTHIGKFPTNPFKIKEALPFLVHPHVRWFLVVGNNVLINSIAAVLSQYLGIPYRMFKTEAAASAFLAHQDSATAD